MAATPTKPAGRSPRKAARKAGTSAKGRRSPEGPWTPPTGTLVPSLAMEDCAKAMEWYRRALGAQEIDRQLAPDGKVLQAILRVGSSWISLSDVLPGADTDHPISLGGTTCRLHLHTEDVDRLWDRAVAAGAQVTLPLATQPGGNRLGTFRDPFGHVWSLSRPADLRLEGQALDASPGGRPTGHG